MGFRGDDLQTQAALIRRLFVNRKQPLECIPYTVDGYDLLSSIRAIESVIDAYEQPIFDITGGDPLLVLALGIVLQRHSDHRFQVHRFSVSDNRVLDCDRDGVTVYKDTPQLSVQEAVSLYKGEVIFGNVDEPLTYRWDCNIDFVDDCRAMWSICRVHTGHWNKHIAAFHALAESDIHANNRVDYCLSRQAWDELLEAAGVRYYYNERIGESLTNAGLLTAYEIHEQHIHIAFKNEQVKRALTKAGQALELYTFLTLRTLKSDAQTSLFHDVLNGVVIDWDGKRESLSDDSSKSYEVENEVDILAMRDMVPVFISCKNGYVDSSELYKIEAVAERFGGGYAKKVLVTSSRSVSGAAGRTLLKRARDMGIAVIHSVDQIGESDFSRALESHLKPIV